MNSVELMPGVMRPNDDYYASLLDAWRPARPTAVFASYWYFAAARQSLFFRRLSGEAPPWTTDPILLQHRFTNAYRASDRISQYLIQHVIYPPGHEEFTEDDIFFRVLLYKIFNKIETWQLLERVAGPIRWNSYCFSVYDAALTQAMTNKETIFSAAYIMPSGQTDYREPRKHQNYLRILNKMMVEKLPEQLARAKSLRKAFELLREQPLLGDFLAFQYVIDLNYSPLMDFKENSFVVAGPGARDGITKCFAETGGLGEEEIIRLMTDRQNNEFARLGVSFESLWGRQLQLIDCQNLFCEVGKYARVAHPDIKDKSGRTRIKQVYHYQKAESLPKPWYPPKWQINKQIDRYFSSLEEMPS